MAQTISGLTPEQIGRAARSNVSATLAALGAAPETRLLDRIESFAASLTLWGRSINLTSAPDDPSELAFHIVDSLMPLVLAMRPEGLQLGELLDPACTILDLGAGAGFPGLILAAWSNARFTLLESRRKRANFLRVTAAAMELANVTVKPVRMGPADLSPTFAIVLGRAFAKPASFYQTAAAALRSQGLAILYASPEQPLPAAAAGLGDYLNLDYLVPRGRTAVARRLVLWRKSS